MENKHHLSVFLFLFFSGLFSFGKTSETWNGVLQIMPVVCQGIIWVKRFEKDCSTGILPDMLDGKGHICVV